MEEKTKEKIRLKFSQILEDKRIIVFWVDLMEIMKILGEGKALRMKNLEHVVKRVHPLTECFFIAFKILGDDDLISDIKKKNRKN